MTSTASRMTIKDPKSGEATIIMTRMFDSPIEKVWECFTRPEHVKVWFGGAGFSNPICEMDVRTGGTWKHVMRTPNGQEYAIDSVYVEVKKPTRLVWQDVDYGRRSSGPPARLTEVTLEDHGAQTKWRMVARFACIADRDLARSMGFTETLTQGCEKFNTLVKTL
jgi:uncharacterized protein YndB with AHSA1/START domain